MQVSWTAKKTNECVLKICTSVKTFTHVHKTPIHSLSWECCNETFQCLISRCPSFHCNGKIIFIYFLPGTRGPWTLPNLPTPLLRHCCPSVCLSRRSTAATAAGEFAAEVVREARAADIDRQLMLSYDMRAA